jgi:hypothetical protein
VPTLGVGSGLNNVVTLRKSLANGVSWSVEAVSPDGQLVVDVARPASAVGSRVRLNQSRAGLLDPATKQITYMTDARRTGRPTQMIGSAATRRWVAWVESPSTDTYTEPWTLYSYDRVTHQTRLVARAPSVSESPTPAVPDGTRPSISGGRVYVAAVAAVHRGEITPAIFSARLDGAGGLREEVRSATDPHAGHGSMGYLKWVGTTWQVRTRDLATGADEAVTEFDQSRHLAGFAGDGQVVTWATIAHHQTTVWVRPADGVEKEVLTSRATIYYLNVTPRFVTFSTAHNTGYRSFIYDLTTDVLSRLTATDMVRSPYGFGSNISWSPVNRNGVSRVEKVALLR